MVTKRGCAPFLHALDVSQILVVHVFMKQVVSFTAVRGATGKPWSEGGRSTPELGLVADEDLGQRQHDGRRQEDAGPNQLREHAQVGAT
jgi:hypothetical protein